MGYSTDRERVPEDFDADGADAHVTVAEICPFLDIWGVSRIWCIVDIVGLSGVRRDILALEGVPIRRSGAEWWWPTGEFVLPPTNTHVSLVFSENSTP